MQRKGAGDFRTLIETALPRSAAREWDRNYCRTLFHYVDGPGLSRHSFRHCVRHSEPSVVLERMHDVRSCPRANPAERACRADEGRKQCAPATRIAVTRVTAPLASWMRQFANAGPAVSTHNSRLARHQALAYD